VSSHRLSVVMHLALFPPLSLAAPAAEEVAPAAPAAEEVAPAAGQWAYEIRGPETYPTLEGRELGEPFVEERVWARALPFFAQDVINLGFDLPNPYGTAVVGAVLRQDIQLSNLKVGVNGQPWEKIGFVDFGQPREENSTVQAKLDAWLFPFMNVYMIGGAIDGHADLEVGVPGDELLDFLGLGVLCAPPIGTPADICSRTLASKAHVDYTGSNVGVGVNLAMGWDRFFVTLPITYVWSDISVIDSTVEALNVSPRIGVTGDVGDMGVIALFVGATYLDATVGLSGRFSFDTSGVPGLDDTSTINFKLTETNKDKWNYVVGGNWDVSKRWSVLVEAGVGGSRENLIVGATYRW
jgi:hypothetical protein